jgi:DNA-directed RNA polymerase specialized sigma24 family protein
VGGVRFQGRKARKFRCYAHSRFVGRAFSGCGRGSDPDNLPQALGGGSHLRDFAIQRPEAIWGYLKRTAANATHDYFKHSHSQSSGGSTLHLSTSDIDPKAGREVHGSEEQIASSVFLQEIDEHLKHCLTSPDQERDRMIFWLYFRQGMSTKEIASLPAIGLSAKGVGSVIERVKHSIRDQILGTARNSDDKQG